jgi:hypothetical protein
MQRSRVPPSDTRRGSSDPEMLSKFRPRRQTHRKSPALYLACGRGHLRPGKRTFQKRMRTKQILFMCCYYLEVV